MRVQPTALGIKAFAFYVVVVLVFYAAPYSNLFFLLIAFATVLGLAGIAGSMRNVAGVQVRVDAVAPVPAGSQPRVHSEVGVRGRGPGRWRIGLVLGVQLDGEREQCIGAAWTEEGGQLAGHLSALPRGIHTIRRARIMSTWPFGMLRASRTLDMPGDVVVYPAPLAPDDSRGGAGSGGETGAPVASDGLMQPSTLREFRTGDALKHVHWRSMARTGRPVVVEWEGGQGDGFEFVLDRRCEAPELEHALSLLATFAQRARDEKAPITLHTQGLSASFGGGRGQRSLRELWYFLAGAQTLDAGDAAPPPAGPHVQRLPRRGDLS